MGNENKVLFKSSLFILLVQCYFDILQERDSSEVTRQDTINALRDLSFLQH